MEKESSASVGPSSPLQHEKETERVNNELREKIDSFLFEVDRSVRYHESRVRHYERWHRTTAACGLLFGSAAIYAILKLDGDMAIIAAAIVTSMSVIDLVAGTTEKAALHRDLSRRFIQLNRKIIRCLHPTRADLAKWQARKLAIEMDEPPVMRALDALIYGEVVKARGLDLEYVPIVPACKRFFCQFIRFSSLDIVRPIDIRRASESIPGGVAGGISAA